MTQYKRYGLKKEIWIGRDLQNDIVVEKGNISKKHARIFYENGWYIVDCDSKNGVYVNMKRTRKKKLSMGDYISLVGFDLYFCDLFLNVSNIAVVHLDEFVPTYTVRKRKDEKQLYLIEHQEKPTLPNRSNRRSLDIISSAFYPFVLLYFKNNTYFLWISLFNLFMKIMDYFYSQKYFLVYKKEMKSYKEYLHRRFPPCHLLEKYYLVTSFDSYQVRLGTKDKEIILHDFKKFPRLLLVGDREKRENLLIQIIYQMVQYYPNIEIDFDDAGLPLLFCPKQRLSQSKILGINKQGDMVIDSVDSWLVSSGQYDAMVDCDEGWYFSNRKVFFKQDELFNKYILSDYLGCKKTPSFYGVMGIHVHEIKHIRMSLSNTNSLKGLLGMKQNQIAYLDLHEQKQGPHLLVVGMSGSGKSEWLTSYLLSLAIFYDSSDVRFFVIDFKGGVLCSLFEKLHHTCMVLSNLHPHQIYRAIAALEDEVEYREKLLLRVGKELQQLITDIHQLKMLYLQKKTSMNLAHLMIVVDEFAELKMIYPEMMDSLIRIARTGRSLGIHLILCTQKASGIVDRQIESNIQSVVCFKVANKQDSYDVLGNNHAYLLTKAGQLVCHSGNEEIDSETVWIDQQEAIVFKDLNEVEQYRIIYKQNPQSNKEACIYKINQDTQKCPPLYIKNFCDELIPPDFFGIYDDYKNRQIVPFTTQEIRWMVGGMNDGYLVECREKINTYDIKGDFGIIFFDRQMIRNILMKKIDFEIDKKKGVGALYLKGELYQCKICCPVI